MVRTVKVSRESIEVPNFRSAHSAQAPRERHITHLKRLSNSSGNISTSDSDCHRTCVASTLGVIQQSDEMTDNMESSRNSAYRLSVVVPMHNEDETIRLFFDEIEPVLATLDCDYEIVCVNDGSKDDTLALLIDENQRDPRIKIVDLSRNFGKEAALTAGLEFASGDCVVPIDADLQDPPSLIPQMVEKWREGYEVVLAIRSDRTADSFTKKTTAGMFYRLMGKIGDVEIIANAGDFRLMDRCVIEALLRLPERTRFMKGLFAWLGFRQTSVYYQRPERIAGTTKWNYWRLWNFALEGILSFTTLPLRVWTYLGMAVTIFAAIYAFVILTKTLFFGADVPGYPSIMVTILFFSGILMVGLGVIGEYLGRVFIEVKQRPLFIVRSAVGFPLDERSPPE
jgi:glycosyltransferase involved in cell wall biosynthesis